VTLLEWLLPPAESDAILGDLEELHAAQLDARGPLRARAWYWMQALRLMAGFVGERRHSPRPPAPPSARKGPLIKGLSADATFAWRMMRKNPWMSAAAVCSLGGAMGVTIGAFSLLWDTRYAELPFTHGDRIIRIYDTTQTAAGSSPPLGVFRAWEERQTSFDTIAAAYTRRREIADGTGGFVRYPIATITAAGLALPGVPPLAGRLLTSADQAPGAPPVAVISHRVWLSLFGSDREIIGHTLTIDRDRYTIVGIMPEGFRFPMSDDVWVPMGAEPAGGVEPRWLDVFGRLAAGTGADQAQAELGAIRAAHAADHPELPELRDRRTSVVPYTRLSADPQADLLAQGMFVFVILVLVVAAGSVANLLFSRALARSGEMAVRSAMGAGRGRLIRQMFIEALLLTTCGALVGVLGAHLGLMWFKSYIPVENLPFWVEFGLIPPAAVFTVVAALLTAAVAGIVPAYKATGGDVNDVLKDGQRGTSGFRFGSITGALTVVEVALAVAFLAGTGQAARSLTDAVTSSQRLPTRELLVADVALVAEYNTDAAGNDVVAEGSIPPEQWTLAAEQVRAAVAGLSGVRAAAIGDALPSWQHRGTRIEIEGPAGGEPAAGVRVLRAVVSPEVFATFDRTVAAGRGFSPADTSASEPVAIVNAAFARRFFGDEHPVGRRFREVAAGPPSSWLTIVGIVAGLPMNPAGEGAAGFYRPFAQERLSTFSLVARVAGPPLAASAAVKAAVARVDPRITVTEFMTHEDRAAMMTVAYQIMGLVFISLGGAALLLAVAGLYSVMSFSVTQRTREIGIRLALGASESRVLGVVLGRGLRQIAIGVGVGSLAGAALLRVLAFLPIGTSPDGPWLLAAAGAAMLVAGLGACLVPVSRALRIQPLEALRHE
jgi:predicted permease